MAYSALDPLRIPSDFWQRPEACAALEMRDAGRLFQLMHKYAGASQTRIGVAVGLAQGTVSTYINGGRVVCAIDVLERIADGLAMPDHARHRLGLAPRGTAGARIIEPHLSSDRDDHDDDEEALELARRVAASDIGEETMFRLELAVDDLATKYSVTPPAELLGRVRRHLKYVARMLEPTVRKTLNEHRRLLVVGGWLSLLGATLHIDLKQRTPGNARLMTAASLARQAGHDEIYAWCFETRAWGALTDGDYRKALGLSQAGQRIAPKGSSAAIQSTAQEGRAWARLGQPKETYAALDRVNRLVSPLPRPDRPEHHYRYDPDKSVAYTATTLAWIGDAAAEQYAREVIAKLRSAEEAGGWPRRVAAAHLDLGLALIAADKFDEAAAATQTAILSGRIVPSNHWRALEVVTAVEAKELTQGPELRDAFETMRRQERTVLPNDDARSLHS
jgi:tetratricopeptide (TPR) repeat protein